MAKNQYGFMSKRYPRPKKYDRIFSSWDAIYNGKDGKEYMIEADYSHLAAISEGARIEQYLVLRQDEDCRRVIGRSKTQKGAIEILSRYCNFS